MAYPQFSFLVTTSPALTDPPPGWKGNLHKVYIPVNKRHCNTAWDSQKWELFKKMGLGVPVVAQWLMNPTRNYEAAGSIPALAQWGKNPALL